jgi:hypothetical protein
MFVFFVAAGYGSILMRKIRRERYLSGLFTVNGRILNGHR